MPENSVENAQKIYEKTLKGSNNGILRYEIHGIIRNAHLPVTVTEIMEKLAEINMIITRPTIWQIIRELKEVRNTTDILKSVDRRVGITIAQAYYFNKLNR